jgi:hypothetical protein
MNKSFVYIDVTLAGLKKNIMKKAGYSADTIENYIKKLRCAIKMNTTRLNVSHADVDLYSEANADVLQLQIQNSSMEWNTMSSSVIRKSNEMGRSSIQSNDGRYLSQCTQNYQKWLAMS